MPDNDPDFPSERAAERDIAAHIFSSSAMMIGLCLTVICFLNGRENRDNLSTIVDDVVAVDALLFLVSCFFSYGALRSRHMGRMHHVETIADAIFLIGMTGMGIACVLFVWTIW